MAYANRFDRNRLNAPRAGGQGEQMAEQAVALAGQGEWRQAAELNRELLKNHPKDTRTLNRLGRCMTELGHYEAATALYSRTLECDRQNEIARKNLERLTLLVRAPAEPATEPAIADPKAFVTDAGRSTVTLLRGKADPEALAACAPGGQLELKEERGGLRVYDRQGRSLGALALPVARRLLPLLRGGNTYTVALVAVAGNSARVVLRETYRHPSQANMVSFLTPVVATVPASDKTLRSLDEDDDEETERSLAPTDGEYPEAELSEDEEHDPFANESPRVHDSV